MLIKTLTMGFVFFTITVILDSFFGKNKVNYLRWAIFSVIYMLIYWFIY